MRKSLETLKSYAEENKHNIELIDSILKKARPQKAATGVHCAGLTHRETLRAAGLRIPEVEGNGWPRSSWRSTATVLLCFAPLYLSNYCVNGCVYTVRITRKTAISPAS